MRMRNPKYRNSDKRFQLETRVSIGLAFLCFLFLLLAYYFITLPSFNRDKSDARLSKYEAHKEYLLHSPVAIDNDSVRTLKQLDIALRYIEKNEKILAERQADLVNDIRQETNNVIEKVNLWLTFAIGLISVFGIFIPLILEHRNRNDIKDAIEEIKADYERSKQASKESWDQMKNDFEIFRKSISSDIIQKKATIQKEYTVLKTSIEEDFSRLNQQERIQQFRSGFIALSLGFDDRVISTQPDRERMLEYLWSKTVESLTFVVEFSRREGINVEDRRLWLIESFVLISSFISRIRGHVEIRSRHIDHLIDEVRFLLSYLQIDNKSQQYWDMIYQQISSIMKTISKIRIRG